MSARHAADRHGDAAAQTGGMRKNSDAAVSVLLDGGLIAHITDFQSGYPYKVAAMVRSVASQQLQHARGWSNDTEEQRDGILCRLAVEVSDTQTLRLLFELKKQPQYETDRLINFTGTMSRAVWGRRTAMLEYLGELKTGDSAWEWEPNLMTIAVYLGDIRMIKWLYEHLPRELSAALQGSVVISASRGEVEVIHWLHEHDYEIEGSAADGAASSGRVEVLTYLYQRTDARCSSRAVCDAAARGELEVVRIIALDLMEETYESALSAAASHGRLEVVKYFVERGVGVAGTTLAVRAAWGGHLTVVQYLHERLSDDRWTTDAMDGATSNGHIDIIRFLCEHRSEGCTTSAMDDAAAHGHLDVIKLLHENRVEGCTADAMNKAAAGGYLKVVKFLHEHRAEGCTARAMDDAAEGGYLDVITFLHENRSEGCTIGALYRAAMKHHVHVVEFFCKHRSEDCDIGAVMVSAASRGQADMVELLYKSFTTVSMLDELVEPRSVGIEQNTSVQIGVEAGTT